MLPCEKFASACKNTTAAPWNGMRKHLCQFHKMCNSKLEERFCPVSAKQKTAIVLIYHVIESK